MRRVSRIVGLLAMTWAGCSTVSVPQSVPFPEPPESPSASSAESPARLCSTDLTIQPRWLPPLAVAPNGVVLGTADRPHPLPADPSSPRRTPCQQRSTEADHTGRS